MTITTPLHVNWWVLDSSDDEEFLRGFTPQEQNLFMDFMVSREVNFPGRKNYHIAQHGDEPQLIFQGFVSDGPKLKLPKRVYLRNKPKLYYKDVLEDMNIVLCEPNFAEVAYNLDFVVVGELKV